MKWLNNVEHDRTNMRHHTISINEDYLHMFCLPRSRAKAAASAPCALAKRICKGTTWHKNAQNSTNLLAYLFQHVSTNLSPDRKIRKTHAKNANLSQVTR